MTAPWACPRGNPARTGAGSAPGPSRGTVGARWPFPRRLRTWVGPVIGPGGRVAVAIDATVLVFGPDLKEPAVVDLHPVQHLAATADGGWLVATAKGSACIQADGDLRWLAVKLDGRQPEGIVELPGGDLWAWRGPYYARAGVDGRVRAAGDAWPGHIDGVHVAWALAGDGSRALVLAFEIPAGRGGLLVAASPDGIPLFLRERASARLPLESGLAIELLALPEGILLADRGAILVDWDGQERWREPAADAHHFAQPAPGTLAWVRDGRRVLRRSPSGSLEQILELPRSERIVDLAADSAGTLYLAATQAVLACDLQGHLRFRLPLAGVQSLCVGEGFLIAVQHPLALVRVD